VACNSNSVEPEGAVAPFWYFETKPKFALPVMAGSATYAPVGDWIQPPPVTNPPFGS
jgi:hypothetical protein